MCVKHIWKSLYSIEFFLFKEVSGTQSSLFCLAAGGDWTVSLTDGSLATLEGIQLQLAANLVGPNVQISGIDASTVSNITLQVRRLPGASAPPERQPPSSRLSHHKALCASRSTRASCSRPCSRAACLPSS